MLLATKLIVTCLLCWQSDTVSTQEEINRFKEIHRHKDEQTEREFKLATNIEVKGK